jgi:hypothetical protein
MTNKVASRASDPESRLYFRSDRFFQVGESWYFMSRENPNVGPYRSHKEATAALTSFLKRANAPAAPIKEAAPKPKVDTKIKWLG